MKFFTFTKACKSWNEDRCFACEDFAFVLDGEGSVTKQVFTDFPSDTEWYSEWWHGNLIEKLKDKSRSIPEILSEGIERVAKEYKTYSGASEVLDHPSCTVSIIRRKGGKLEVFVLGDSPILVQSKTGMIFEISDTVNNINDNVNKMILKDLSLKHGISVLEARKKFPECITNGRLRKNTSGNYFVLAEKPEAISHSVQISFPENLVSKILIMSDGFSQVYDLFEIFTTKELCNKIKTNQDAQQVYDELYACQEKDPECNEFVRFKKRDDSTIVVLDFD